MFWTPKTSGSVPPVLDDVAGIESAQAFLGWTQGASTVFSAMVRSCSLEASENAWHFCDMIGPQGIQKNGPIVKNDDQCCQTCVKEVYFDSSGAQVNTSFNF